MKSMVDIDVILNDRYVEPKVTIHARERSLQVERIIEAIENASENDFPAIPASRGSSIELLSQRDIIRAYTDSRKVMIQTSDGLYTCGRTLSDLEGMLNPERFVRISQSEITNLYKVSAFDFDRAGTIGITYENGEISWVSRSRVRQIKSILKSQNK